MYKHRYLTVLTLLTLICTSCSRNVKSEEKRGNSDSKKADVVKSENKIPDDLEQFIGRFIEDLSEAMNAEPNLTEMIQGENGYLEQVFFEFRGDTLLYGHLRVDDLLSSMLQDPTLYITNISVALPYSNTAGIQAGDDAETVKKKLSENDIYFEESGDSFYYHYDGYKYSIAMFGEGNTAAQIQIYESAEQHPRGRFEAYCAAFPCGYHLGNGDYIVATDKGLLQIIRNRRAYSLDTWKADGTLMKVDNDLIFSLGNGSTRFLVSQEDGSLTLADDITAHPSTGPQENTLTDNPALKKYKETVKKYQEYALDKWGYDTKRFYDVADFNNDGIPELYSITDLSSPTPGTMRQSKLEIFSLVDDKVTLWEYHTAAEPILQGGTDFVNYYLGFVPGEGHFLIYDNVSTRLGNSHYLRVGRITGYGIYEEVDSVEFAYPNMDPVNGELITDYPRAAELLSKYGVNYDSILIGLDSDYRLLFGYGYNDGGNSYEYLQQIVSGAKDGEIMFRLTGEWVD